MTKHISKLSIIVKADDTNDSPQSHNAGASQDSNDRCPDGPNDTLAPVAPLRPR
jgi:hypothetical protein